MSKQLDKAKRKAAGAILLHLFGFSNSLSYALTKIAAAHPPEGEGLADGLTEKERALVTRLAQRASADGRLYRQLGWRLLGKKQ